MNNLGLIMDVRNEADNKASEHFDMVYKILTDFVVLREPCLSYHYFVKFSELHNSANKYAFMSNYLSTVAIYTIKLIIEQKIKSTVINNTFNIIYDKQDNSQIITPANNIDLKHLRALEYKFHHLFLGFYINKIDNSVDSNHYHGLRRIEDPIEFLHYALPEDDCIRDIFNDLSFGGYTNLSTIVTNILMHVFSTGKLLKKDEFSLLLFILIEFCSFHLKNFVNINNGETISCTNRHPFFAISHGIFFTIEELYMMQSIELSNLDIFNKLDDSNGHLKRYRLDKIEFFLNTVANFLFMQETLRKEKREDFAKKKTNTNVVDFLSKRKSDWKRNFEGHKKMITDIVSKL